MAKPNPSPKKNTKTKVEQTPNPLSTSSTRKPSASQGKKGTPSTTRSTRKPTAATANGSARGRAIKKPTDSAPKPQNLKVSQAGETAPKVRRGRFKYDACFSFAGEDRKYVQRVVDQLKKIDPTLNIFYDNDQEVELWGKNLPAHFDGIYQYQSRFCVMFISSHYAKKEWTTLERGYALARTLTNKGKEYILPAYFDETTLSGVPRSLGHADLEQLTPEQLAQRIVRKLKRNAKIEQENAPVQKVTKPTGKTTLPQGTRRTPTTKSTKAKPSGPAVTSELSYNSQIKGSGAWMLLDGEFYLTRKVEEVSGHIQVTLGKVASEDIARLSDLDPSRSGRHRGRISYAHGEDAAWVDVESVQTISTAGKREVVLKLRPARGSSGAGVSWSDDNSKEQVSALLLTERGTQTAISGSLRSEYYSFGGHHRGQKNLFVAAWDKMNDGKRPIGDILRCARLEAIFQLKTKGIIEHVLQLNLGPIKKGVLSVDFRGRRSQAYGETVQPFDVKGMCKLASDT